MCIERYNLEMKNLPGCNEKKWTGRYDWEMKNLPEGNEKCAQEDMI